MAQSIPASISQNLIVVGGGIVGLCIAVAAQAHGHAVTVVARDARDDTASGVAAGMIAPALEAINDPEPDHSYARLKAAQSSWFDLFDAWPQAVRQAILRAQDHAYSRYVWPQSDNTSDHVTPRLAVMGVDFTPLDDRDLQGLAVDCNGVSVSGELLIEAGTVLAALEAEIADHRSASVRHVTATSVTLDTGEVVTADVVIVAAGYGAHQLAGDVPCLGHLEPIKGHILELAGQGGLGVTRSSYGYLADYGEVGRFGATMQFGATDTAIEPAMVEKLKFDAREIMPALNTDESIARTGIRAASPDGWPMIGRDSASGVYVAVGMRRNGYIFAPLAARLILDLLANGVPIDAAAYNPDRF